ncbi:MAG TPA: FliH/SctL family protein [Solirubrobacteraceae bacterium]|jgi:flagellar assembly protein FliH|nr:FliH/SctL family protein [Solirubrobacteraceae bacterium]
MSSQNISAYTFRQLESSVELDGAPADVIARAWAEADTIREQARLEGGTAGYAEGIERAKAEASPAAAALAEAIRAVGGTRDEVVETLTRQAGELAVLIAEQIVAGAFTVEPERIVDVTRAALRRLADRHHVTVLVNPDDLELLTSAVQTLQSELGGIEHLDVQADRRIERGGAIAQTAYGEIDATIGVQLQAARELVEAAVSGDISDASLDDDDDAGEAVRAGGL